MLSPLLRGQQQERITQWISLSAYVGNVLFAMNIQSTLSGTFIKTIAISIVFIVSFLWSWLVPAHVVLAEKMPNPGFHHSISSQFQEVQHYFNQGLLLIYGLNGEAAMETFQAAIAVDPNCVLCYWGIAYALGGFKSTNLEPHRKQLVATALQQAIAHQSYASPAEQAWIQAFYDAFQGVTSVVTAMEKIVSQYPNDPDAATLLAMILMDQVKWQLWTVKGELTTIGHRILLILEGVLGKYPNHPGALHFYIHGVEPQHPEWGIPAADRLRTLSLNVAHLVHMPAHIYVRVGRYADALSVNQQAMAIAAQSASHYPSTSLFSYAYLPHNYHFQWHLAMVTGQKKLAEETAQQMVDLVDRQLVRQPGYGTLQHFLALPLYTKLQFGQWDEILTQSPPPIDLMYWRGVWHYARGSANLSRGKGEAALQEWHQLCHLIHHPDLNPITMWGVNSASDLLKIAAAVLRAKIAVQYHDWHRASLMFREAIDREDALKYDDPPAWTTPVRQLMKEVYDSP